MRKSTATKRTRSESSGSGGNLAVRLPGPEDVVGWALLGRDHQRRRLAIRLLLAQNPKIPCGDMAQLFGVHPDTITDDLSALRSAAGLAFRQQDVAEVVADEIRLCREVAESSLEDASILSPGNPSRSRHRMVALRAMDSRRDLLFRMGYYREVPKEFRILTEGTEKDDRQAAIQDEIWAAIGDPEKRRIAVQLEALLQESPPDPSGAGERHDAGEVSGPVAHRAPDGGVTRARSRKRGPTDRDDAPETR